MDCDSRAGQVTGFAAPLMLILLGSILLWWLIPDDQSPTPPEPNMLTPYRFTLSEDGEVQLPDGGYLKTMKVKDEQTDRTYIHIEGMGFLETTR